MIQQERFVKELEEAGAGLVDTDDDDLVVRQPTNQLQHVLGILGGQSRGRLIEEVDVGNPDHVQPRVEPLALATGEDFDLVVPGFLVPHFAQPQLGQLGVGPPFPIGIPEIRRPDRGRQIKVFLHREQGLDRFLVGNEGHVRHEPKPIPDRSVETDIVEQNLPAAGPEMSRQGPQQRALAAPARPHDADHFPALHGEADRIEGRICAIPMGYLTKLETADEVSLLFDDPFGEMAAQKLAVPNGDGISIAQGHPSAHHAFPDGDGPIAAEDFQLAGAVVVIAADPQEEPSALVAGNENVPFLKIGGVIGNRVLRPRRIEVEPGAEDFGPSPEVEQRDLGAIIEFDAVPQGRLDGHAFPQAQAVDGGGGIAERRDGDCQAEPHFKIGLTALPLFDIGIPFAVER